MKSLSLIIIYLPLLLFLSCRHESAPFAPSQIKTYGKGIITGKVTLNGRPIDGAIITASFSTNSLYKEYAIKEDSKTTITGDYSIELIPGEYNVQFTCTQDRFYQQNIYINLNAGETVNQNIEMSQYQPNFHVVKTDGRIVSLKWDALSDINSLLTKYTLVCSMDSLNWQPTDTFYYSDYGYYLFEGSYPDERPRWFKLQTYIADTLYKTEFVNALPNSSPPTASIYIYNHGYAFRLEGTVPNPDSQPYKIAIVRKNLTTDQIIYDTLSGLPLRFESFLSKSTAHVVSAFKRLDADIGEGINFQYNVYVIDSLGNANKGLPEPLVCYSDRLVRTYDLSVNPPVGKITSINFTLPHDYEWDSIIVSPIRIILQRCSEGQTIWRNIDSVSIQPNLNFNDDVYDQSQDTGTFFYRALFTDAASHWATYKPIKYHKTNQSPIPYDFKLSNNGKSIEIKGIEISGNFPVVVFRKLVNDTAWTIVDTVSQNSLNSSPNAWICTDYPPRTGYYYYCAAYLDTYNGKIGLHSGEHSINFINQMPAPIITASNYGNYVKIYLISPVSGATYYNIYRSTSLSVDSLGIRIASSEFCSLYVDFPPVGKTYFYKGQALTADSQKSQTGVSNKVDFTGILEAPDIKINGPIDNIIGLSVVENNTVFTSKFARVPLGTSDTTWINQNADTLLKRGIYYYTAFLVDSNNVLGYPSVPVMFNFNGIPAPNKPKLSIDSISNRIVLNYSGFENTVEILRSVILTGPYISVAITSATYGWIDSNIQSNNYYSYKIIRITNGMQSDTSESSDIWFHYILHAPDSLIVTCSGDKDVNLRWTPVSGAISYNIYRSPRNNSYTFYLNTTVLTCVDTFALIYSSDLEEYESINQYYKVVAVDSQNIEGRARLKTKSSGCVLY